MSFPLYRLGRFPSGDIPGVVGNWNLPGKNPWNGQSAAARSAALFMHVSWVTVWINPEENHLEGKNTISRNSNSLCNAVRPEWCKQRRGKLELPAAKLKKSKFSEELKKINKSKVTKTSSSRASLRLWVFETSWKAEEIYTGKKYTVQVPKVPK